MWQFWVYVLWVEDACMWFGNKLLLWRNFFWKGRNHFKLAQAALGVRKERSVGQEGGCFSQKSQLESRVLVCLEIARGGWDEAQSRLGLAAWFGQVILVLWAPVCSATNTIQHKRGLLGIRTWLPCVTSPRPSHRFIHSLFSLIIRVGVRWGWMQLLVKLEGHCLQIKLN